jgi:hypothetical protein
MEKDKISEKVTERKEKEKVNRGLTGSKVRATDVANMAIELQTAEAKETGKKETVKDLDTTEKEQTSMHLLMKLTCTQRGHNLLEAKRDTKKHTGIQR